MICINIPLGITQLINLLNLTRENSVKTFLILSTRGNILLEYAMCGIDDFVFEDDSEINIECRILRLLNFTKTIETQVQIYEYISYIPPKKEMYIKGNRVALTSFESVFINYLITNNGICNMLDFQKYINCISNHKVEQKSIVVGISRFKRKVYISTGYKILKSRYGLGYEIKS